MPLIDTVIMLGKTGSGKDTQAELLRQKTNFKIFSSGGRFREIKTEDTVLGNRIREDLDNGYLMPHWLATFVFEEPLFKLKAGEGIIFEGMARKRPEAEMFHEIATWLNRVYICVHLVVPDDEIIVRQLKRGREDSNTKEKLNTRLEEYYKYTTSVIDFFNTENKVINIDGIGTPQEIHERVMEALRGRGVLRMEPK